MIVLSFDTAEAACSAALWRDGETLAHRRERLGRGHAERLFPMLEEILAEAKLGWDAIDRIGVIAGPGSFTGLRVGVAAARGLSLALGRPAIGLDGFEAIAAGLAEAGDVERLAVCAGRPPRLFWRLFELRQGRALALGERRDGEVDALAADAPTLVAGPAVEALAASETALALAPDAIAPDPVLLARLTAEADPSADRPKPLYSRAPDATPAKPAPTRLGS